MSEHVAVLGASPKPERYSYKACAMLAGHGHRVTPINPYHPKVAGIPSVARLSDIGQSVDTVTVYMRGQLLAPLVDDLLALSPRRVIFNPGSEDADIEKRLQLAGVVVEEACTLVLLRTGQF